MKTIPYNSRPGRSFTQNCSKHNPQFPEAAHRIGNYTKIEGSIIIDRVMRNGEKRPKPGLIADNDRHYAATPPWMTAADPDLDGMLPAQYAERLQQIFSFPESFSVRPWATLSRTVVSDRNGRRETQAAAGCKQIFIDRYKIYIAHAILEDHATAFFNASLEPDRAGQVVCRAAGKNAYWNTVSHRCGEKPMDRSVAARRNQPEFLGAASAAKVVDQQVRRVQQQ